MAQRHTTPAHRLLAWDPLSAAAEDIASPTRGLLNVNAIFAFKASSRGRQLKAESTTIAGGASGVLDDSVATIDRLMTRRRRDSFGAGTAEMSRENPRRLRTGTSPLAAKCGI